MSEDSYQLQILQKLSDISADEWNSLLPTDSDPFVTHEFLNALELTHCVGSNTGWQIAHLILRDREFKLVAAMPMYLKQHSYGEFVFDWAWAQAYEESDIPYYPKALSAIPFTPVKGRRILIAPNQDPTAIRVILINALKSLVTQNDLSSMHILFPSTEEGEEFKKQGFMLRDSIQFHWRNQGYKNFEDFLAALTMKRRKNIRRERLQVAQESIQYRHIEGKDAANNDWSFFYRCYANTYLEHHSSPYLNEAFFQLLGKVIPENLHLIIANRGGRDIASSLIVLDGSKSTAYGRYWGAMECIPCLHFEVAYYQAIEYCIKQGIGTFEGGAQGEHKMARGFLPTTIRSAHWIANESFAKAIGRFLKREREGMAAYVDELEQHHPLKSTKVQP